MPTMPVEYVPAVSLEEASNLAGPHWRGECALGMTAGSAVNKNCLGDCLLFILLFIEDICLNNGFKSSGELFGSILV